MFNDVINVITAISLSPHRSPLAALVSCWGNPFGTKLAQTLCRCGQTVVFSKVLGRQEVVVLLDIVYLQLFKLHSAS